MFYNVKEFNDLNILNWNILLVIDIRLMFRGVIEFN